MLKNYLYVVATYYYNLILISIKKKVDFLQNRHNLILSALFAKAKIQQSVEIKQIFYRSSSMWE